MLGCTGNLVSEGQMMSEELIPMDWAPAPERRLRDLVSHSALWDADRLRETLLNIGIEALSSQEPSHLILPPPKAFSPKQALNEDDLTRNRYVEVGIVTHGEMSIWWEGVFRRCPAGSVFIIQPGIRYMSHAELPGNILRPHSVVWLALHRGCAVIHKCSVKNRDHYLSEYYSLTDTQVTGYARSIAQEIADRPAHFATVVRGSLLCLFTVLLRAPVYRVSRHSGSSREAKDTDENSFSDRVESYLLSHYHRPVTLAQIARSVECSPAYLCRHFRELTGKTPFEYLRSVRLEAAKELLVSEVPIARIAEMVGFDDPLYFSKVFSHKVGQSPQSYRAECQAQRIAPPP
jgi:AraC-like DNA-binding protein